MRHRKRHTRFGRQNDHRAATLKGLTRSLILHQSIKTTHVKAKEARRVFEHLITTARKDNLAARRRAFAMLGDRAMVLKLFKEIVPLFKEKHGGYTRIIPYNFRKGDGASMVLLELTVKTPETKKPKPTAKHRKEEKAVKPVKETAKEKIAEHHKAAPEITPELKKEKAVEDVKREKAKGEMRKMEKQKGILKKMKGFFRRRTNM